MNTSVIGLFLLLASPQDELDTLFRDFKEPAHHVQAATRLKASAPEPLIPYLVEKIRSDKTLQTEEWLRAAAYRLLTELGGTGEGAGSPYSNQLQIHQVLEGLQEARPAIQGICLRAVERIPVEYATELVQQLVPLTDSQDPLVPIAAVDALGRLGPLAASALPALYPLLADESPARAEKRRQDALLHPNTDFERLSRTTAAYARMSIGGLLVDIQLYPRLNMSGQAAVIEALKKQLLPSLQRGSSEPATLAALPQLLGYLAECAKAAALGSEPRATSIHLLGLEAQLASVPKAASTLAKEALLDLLDDPDSRVAAAAALYVR
jgi:hypothetical protein